MSALLDPISPVSLSSHSIAVCSSSSITISTARLALSSEQVLGSFGGGNLPASDVFHENFRDILDMAGIASGRAVSNEPEQIIHFCRGVIWAVYDNQ